MESKYTFFSVPQRPNLFFEAHIIYQAFPLLAGPTHRPATPGHIVITSKEPKNPMINRAIAFTNLLKTAQFIASKIVNCTNASRVDPACDGGEYISLLPLNGIGKARKPIIDTAEQSWLKCPGYLSTSAGPPGSDTALEEIQSRFIDRPDTRKPTNLYFADEASDKNPFARIMRGEVKSWRIWEDDAF